MCLDAADLEGEMGFCFFSRRLGDVRGWDGVGCIALHCMVLFGSATDGCWLRKIWEGGCVAP